MDDKFYIGGKHSVLSALKNPERIVHEVYVSRKIKDLSFKKIKEVDQIFFKKIFKQQDLNHQNIAALVSPLKNNNLKNELEKNEIKKIVILNGISDPRNIGSILRSALAFNITHVIVEKKYFNQKNPIIIKSSSGAIEFLKIIIASNVKNEIKILKKNNFLIASFDSNASQEIRSYDFNENHALIFGSEGDGIQKSVNDMCDIKLKISINKKIESLNVSNAVSAILAVINNK